MSSNELNVIYKEIEGIVRQRDVVNNWALEDEFNKINKYIEENPNKTMTFRNWIDWDYNLFTTIGNKLKFAESQGLNSAKKDYDMKPYQKYGDKMFVIFHMYGKKTNREEMKPLCNISHETMKNILVYLEPRPQFEKEKWELFTTKYFRKDHLQADFTVQKNNKYRLDRYKKENEMHEKWMEYYKKLNPTNNCFIKRSKGEKDINMITQADVNFIQGLETDDYDVSKLVIFERIPEFYKTFQLVKKFKYEKKYDWFDLEIMKVLDENNQDFQDRGTAEEYVKSRVMAEEIPEEDRELIEFLSPEDFIQKYYDMSNREEVNCLLNVGDPGSGKTSFLKYILNTLRSKIDRISMIVDDSSTGVNFIEEAKQIKVDSDNYIEKVERHFKREKAISQMEIIPRCESDISLMNTILIFEDIEGKPCLSKTGDTVPKKYKNVVNFITNMLNQKRHRRLFTIFNYQNFSKVDNDLIPKIRLIFFTSSLDEDKTKKLLKLLGKKKFGKKPEETLMELLDKYTFPDGQGVLIDIKTKKLYVIAYPDVGNMEKIKDIVEVPNRDCAICRKPNAGFTQRQTVLNLSETIPCFHLDCLRKHHKVGTKEKTPKNFEYTYEEVDEQNLIPVDQLYYEVADVRDLINTRRQGGSQAMILENTNSAATGNEKTGQDGSGNEKKDDEIDTLKSELQEKDDEIAELKKDLVERKRKISFVECGQRKSKRIRKPIKR